MGEVERDHRGFELGVPQVALNQSGVDAGFEQMGGVGMSERIRGSHHIFTKEGIEEILNLQPKGRQAKPYQVKQVRSVILKYRLGGAPDVS